MSKLDADSCPKCGTLSIESDGVPYFSGNSCFHDCVCNDCEAEWINEYTLKNTEIIDQE